MADIERSIKLGIDTGDSLATLGKLKKELANLYVDLEGAEKGSEAFKKLETQIKSTEQSVIRAEGAFGDATDKIRTLSGSGVERATASFGLLKEGIRNLDLDKFKIGIKGAIDAFGGLRNAIIATGIGALVLAVTAIIANFDKLKNAGGLVGKVFKGIGEVIKIVVDGVVEFSNAIGLTNVKLDDGTESMNKYAQAAREVNQSIEELAIQERLLNGEITEGQASRELAAQKRVTAEADAEQEASEVRKKYSKIKFEDLDEDQKMELNATLDLLDSKKKLAELAFNNEIKTIEKNEKTKAEAQKKADDAKAKADAAKAKADADKAEKDRKDKEQKRLDALAQEASDALDDEERKKAAGEKFIADMKAQDEAVGNQMAAAADAELALLQESNDRKAAAEKSYTDMIKAEEEKRLASEEKLQDLKVQAVQGGLTLISDLTSAFAGKSLAAQKRAFKIQKALSIAQVTIDTFFGAQKAFNSQFIPGVPDPTSPVRGAIAAGVAIAAGLGRVAKIAATKFEGSGGGDSGGGGGGAGGGGLAAPAGIPSSSQGPIAPPIFNLGGQQIGGASNMLGGGGSSNQQSPVQVYVTETDIASVSNKVKVIEGNSLFSGGGG